MLIDANLIEGFKIGVAVGFVVGGVVMLVVCALYMKSS